MHTIGEAIDWLKVACEQMRLRTPGEERIDELIDWKLPAELVEVYRRIEEFVLKGADDFSVSLVPLECIRRARVAIYDQDKDDYGVPWAIAFMSYGDTDFLAFDARSATTTGECTIVDCWHESFAFDRELRVVASSFTEFCESFYREGPRAFWV